jgi:hypothetical protein
MSNFKIKKKIKKKKEKKARAGHPILAQRGG